MGGAREVRLSHLPVVLGRAEQSDVRVPDCWVSRRHCSIENRHGVPIVRDLGSTHGTFLNEQRVQEAEIHPGDRLEIGLTTLTAAPARWAGLGWFGLLVGHVLAALLGLAIGYYILCWLRPAEFNWWNLPIPGSWSAVFDEELLA
jgi:hypothetical protein